MSRNLTLPKTETYESFYDFNTFIQNHSLEMYDRAMEIFL